MPRATYKTARHRKKKRILKQAKGYRGARSKLWRTVKETVMRANAYAYRDRKQRKRNFRRLWIIRINAATRLASITYNQFMNGLKRANININRKMLAELAVNDTTAFNKLVDTAKANL